MDTTTSDHKNVKKPSSSSLPLTPDQVYVGRYGRHWCLVGQPLDDEQLISALRKHCFYLAGTDQKKPIYYCCRKYRQAKCPFRGIFVKESHCLYAKGEHNHLVDGNVEGLKKQQEHPKCGIYVDQFGKHLRLIGQLNDGGGEKQQLHAFCLQYGVVKGGSSNKTTLYFRCPMNKGKKQPESANCHFRAIYVHVRLRGTQHTSVAKCGKRGTGNEKNKTTRRREMFGSILVLNIFQKLAKIPDGIYVDQFGKPWRLIGQHLDDEQLISALREHCFYLAGADNKKTIYYCCRKYRQAECPFRGIFVKESHCLYAKKEHNHLVDGN